MPDHTPPTWFFKRLDREEPTEAVPVGELPALVAAFESVLQRHEASVRSLEPSRPGTCAATLEQEIEDVIAQLEGWPQWKGVVRFLGNLVNHAAGTTQMRTLQSEMPEVSSAVAVGRLRYSTAHIDPTHLEAQRAMDRAKQLPGGWMAYAASFLPNEPRETLRVLAEDAVQSSDAHALAYTVLKEWAEEALQRLPESCRWPEQEELPADLQGDDQECPGD